MKLSSFRLVFVFFALLIPLAFGALLIWQGERRVQQFTAGQYLLAERSVLGGAREVSGFVSNLRRELRLFSEINGALLADVLEEPDEQKKYAELAQKVKEAFPYYMAFSVAYDDGQLPFFDIDRGGKIGPACREDLKRFAENQDSHRIYMHARPFSSHYHFDVMVPWAFGEAGEGLFFVSFHLSELALTLNNNQVPGLHLFLVRADDPTAIEVTAEGGRDESHHALRHNPFLKDRQFMEDLLGGKDITKEAFKLPANVLEMAAFTEPVNNTLWLLVGLIDPKPAQKMEAEIRHQNLILFAGMLLFVLLFSLFVLLTACPCAKSSGR